MTELNYASSGVNIKKGDAASRAAYANAKSTFASRKGLIGEPFALDGGFSGGLDMGDYLLVQNDDGVGTKTIIAEMMEKYDTLGQDLCGTVADDAICVGAEVISLTNTFDVPVVEPEILNQLTKSLAEECQKQKIVIPGGEIAELSTMTKNIVWNATAVGIVKKDKFITGKTIQPGQSIIGLRGRVLRSNGFSLARKVCEQAFGNNWYQQEWKEGTSWGEVLLTPSKVYHRLLLDTVLGDFDSPRKFEVHGIVHITGGGIPGNVPRILPEGMGAEFTNLHAPHAAVKDLQKLGKLDEKECYRTWHCGSALMLIVNPEDKETICQTLNTADPEAEAQEVGKVTSIPEISLISEFSGDTLTFPIS